jgi:outer membrane protein assembly factor BamB
LAFVASVCAVVGGLVVAEAQQWPELRGPNRDGTSSEVDLPESWSPSGENLAWSLPFGGRSAPVVHGDRLYLQTSTEGDSSLTRERLVAVDVDTGDVVWEQFFNIYLSDVPQHRVAWASPAVDPETGNVYIFTAGARLAAVSPAGDVLWDRSLPEEYGAISTHGGRTTSPIIEGDMVILNTLLMNWGTLARPGNRYFAFDKTTGQTVWVSAPQTWHYDTNYAPPIVGVVDGQKQLIVGGTDGVFHGIQLNTGKPLWSHEVSKRAILNSILFRDGTLYITHGQENIDTTEMGMVAALTPGGTGPLPPSAVKWLSHGFMPGFASPVMDDQRLYAVDDSAVLGAFDLASGDQVWTHQLGTIQKSSPLLADGKLYVGTENGKFFILRPSATGVEVLDEDLLGSAEHPEPIVASPAVADGRIYVVTMGPPTIPGPTGHVYAIGERRAGTTGATGMAGTMDATGTGAVAQVQVFPYEALLDPGQEQRFTLKLFDEAGNLLREAPATAAEWSLEGLDGTVSAGAFTAPATGTAGLVKATVDGVTGQARVRVIPSLPWTYDFESFEGSLPWWSAHLKVSMTERDGSKVLLRAHDTTVGRRAKVIMGRPDWSNYTVETEVLSTETRRQIGDPGLINQRYMMALFGGRQRLEIHPWQAADEMAASVPFEWDVDVWYRMKLRVQNQGDGTTLVQGKVWRRDEPEPDAWTVEKVDTIGHREGAPGIYADGYSDIFYDNFQVYRNR